MKFVSDEICGETRSTPFMFNNVSSKNRVLYEIMWKNIVERGRPQMILRFACAVTKATDTHPQYVILTAFPLQHWLHERASLLSFTYIASRVESRFVNLP